MNVQVSARSGQSMGTFQLRAGSVAADLGAAIHKKFPKLYPERQRLYRSPSSGDSRLHCLKEDAVLQDGEVIVFKDLGPQISWRTVFIVEYLGPLLLYPLFYAQPKWIYGQVANLQQSKWAAEVQLSALIAWTIHYAKRELETLFVHRFSHATMPLFNLFKNCLYYWGFAAYVSYFVNHPMYTPPPEDIVYAGMCMFYFMEVGNFSCHYTLRQLRPAGSKVRRIPHGGLFDYVTSPNYTYEILAWIGFNLMTRTVAGILFMFAGATQMVLWARGKHRAYKKEFDGREGRDLYPPSRKIIIPFVY